MAGAESVVLFVDMLGFSDLTLKEGRFFAQRSGARFEIVAQPSVAEMQFSRFHTTLDNYSTPHLHAGPERAMIFSDCAFFVFSNSLFAAIYAVRMMRDFV